MASISQTIISEMQVGAQKATTPTYSNPQSVAETRMATAGVEAKAPGVRASPLPPSIGVFYTNGGVFQELVQEQGRGKSDVGKIIMKSINPFGKLKNLHRPGKYKQLF